MCYVMLIHFNKVLKALKSNMGLSRLMATKDRSVSVAFSALFCRGHMLHKCLSGLIFWSMGITEKKSCVNVPG